MDKCNQVNNNKQKEFNPWLMMFFRPRDTVRWLLCHETLEAAKQMWLAFTAMTIVIMFVMITFFPDAVNLPLTRIELVLATPFIFLASYLYFIITSYLLQRFGILMGEDATQESMIMVNSFTTVIPGVIFGILNVVLLLILGIDSKIWEVVQNIGVVWTIYITACGIAAAMGLPTWKGLLVYILTILFFLGWIAVGMMIFL